MDADRRVLIAEDDPVSRLRLARVLEGWGYGVTVANDGTHAWELLQGVDAPLLVIIDWDMPGLDGLDICRRLKHDLDRRHAYVIMLTSHRATADIVTAMDAGADDFVGKPFELDELRVRVRAGYRIVELQRELHRKASHDELTGMYNRRMVIEMLGRELGKASRERQPLAVAVLDIDHFKRVNDSYGHQAGDMVLRETAVRIGQALRRSDVAGRYGGEEFLLVMPGCNDETAAAIAERVRSAIGDAPIQAGEQAIAVSVSIGVVSVAAANDTNFEALVGQADAALYLAKQHGRNRVELAVT